ncbi:hypothetical protein Sjap_001064 [Stephania japonica]|uniref:Uncharacterized protein n=1 Tax=Stephania japonica TaxID=461633 RepID=A0AAP0KLI5_9MAGN
MREMKRVVDVTVAKGLEDPYVRMYDVTYWVDGNHSVSWILCFHALCVLEHFGVERLPNVYVLNRWRKDCIRLHVLENAVIDFRVATTCAQDDRFDFISQRGPYFKRLKGAHEQQDKSKGKIKAAVQSKNNVVAPQVGTAGPNNVVAAVPSNFAASAPQTPQPNVGQVEVSIDRRAEIEKRKKRRRAMEELEDGGHEVEERTRLDIVMKIVLDILTSEMEIGFKRKWTEVEDMMIVDLAVQLWDGRRDRRAEIEKWRKTRRAMEELEDGGHEVEERTR